MYKKFFMGIAAMAALTLVSCSSDDLNSLSDNSSKNEAISFDGYLGRSAVAVNGSRGSELTINNLQTEGFGVFGNYSSADDEKFGFNLFKNQKVTGTTSNGVTKWTYGDVKYWPSQGHIDFFAYAPHDAKYNDDKALNGSKINFIVNSTVTEQKDLLWANATKQTIQTIAKTGNKVKFKFEHALSRLGFSVKLKGESSNDATITLKNITLAGSATESTPGAFYTSGDIDLATGLWDQATLTTKQNLVWFSNSQKVTSTSQSNKYFNTGYLFVIPQNFSQTGNTLYVKVEYTIQYTDVKGSDGQPVIMTNKVYKQLTTDFAQGKAYMINLTIGRPIEFDAEVKEWGTDIPVGSDNDSWDVIE